MSRSCQTRYPYPESETRARVDAIEDPTRDLMQHPAWRWSTCWRRSSGRRSRGSLPSNSPQTSRSGARCSDGRVRQRRELRDSRRRRRRPAFWASRWTTPTRRRLPRSRCGRVPPRSPRSPTQRANGMTAWGRRRQRGASPRQGRALNDRQASRGWAGGRSSRPALATSGSRDCGWGRTRRPEERERASSPGGPHLVHQLVSTGVDRRSPSPRPDCCTAAVLIGTHVRSRGSGGATAAHRRRRITAARPSSSSRASRTRTRPGTRAPRGSSHAPRRRRRMRPSAPTATRPSAPGSGTGWALYRTTSLPPNVALFGSSAPTKLPA